MTWDLTGNVVSLTSLSNGSTFNPTFTATDAYSDTDELNGLGSHDDCLRSRHNRSHHVTAAPDNV